MFGRRRFAVENAEEGIVTCMWVVGKSNTELKKVADLPSRVQQGTKVSQIM